MLIKFFKSGKGGGYGPTDYCCNTLVPTIITIIDPETQKLKSAVLRDENNKPIMKERIPPPEILGGNREQTRKLIDSLDTKWKYTSGVIAFAPEDNPTPEQQKKLMGEFEKTAFAGLDKDQYDILWVRHQHEGSTELHFIIPRVELSTGKSYNAAPPNWEKTFDPLRDAWNYEQAWARPDDLARARLHQPGHVAHQQSENLKAGLAASPDPKKDITEYLTSRIEAGMIEDRAGIVAALEEAGLKLNRKGKDYISVRLESDAKPLRLKGAIYAEDFKCTELIRAIESEDGIRPDRNRIDDQERAREARDKLEDAIRRRTEYNIGRYTKADRQQDKAASQDVERDTNRSIEAERAHDQSLAKTSIDISSDLSKHLDSVLGAECIYINDYRISDKSESRTIESDSSIRSDSIKAGSEDHGGDDHREQGRKIPSIARRYDSNDWVDNWKAASSKVIEKLKETYDRVRTAVIESIGKALDSIRNGTESATTNHRDLNKASESIITASQSIERSIKQTRVVMENRTDELEHFKQRINLVEYAESKGYEIDRQESSRASVVMRNGEDKIIVATDAKDGHSVYFSVRNESDNGSIIDFVQRRQGLNLGQTRKELRPWIGESSQTTKRKPEAERPRKPEPSNQDRQQVLRVWMQMQETSGKHAYLEKERKIKAKTLEDVRFKAVVRIDSRGNALFPHFDRSGISGFEIKNKEFTGFSKSGQKALWYSTNIQHAKKIVIVESAIDAMSHAQLKSKETDVAYISTGGSMSEHQRELVQAALTKAHERGVSIIIATDNDEQGKKLANELKELAPKLALLVREEPTRGKDWNEQLVRSLQQERSRMRL
jgi:5S rRNA maturation endonuclease (ribonuclease M5)